MRNTSGMITTYTFCHTVKSRVHMHCMFLLLSPVGQKLNLGCRCIACTCICRQWVKRPGIMLYFCKGITLRTIVKDRKVLKRKLCPRWGDLPKYAYLQPCTYCDHSGVWPTFWKFISLAGKQDYGLSVIFVISVKYWFHINYMVFTFCFSITVGCHS